ncbi:MAG TPA: PAS domain-containing protein [Dongiaceae bacterium]|jgi:hypothetical protein
MDVNDPEWLSRASDYTKLMYAHWRSRCRGNALPRRADIDPIDLPPRLLPCITIVGVVPDERQYIYRLVGTRDVDVRGSDPTGKSVVERYFGSSLEEALRFYDTVVATRAPAFNPTPYVSADGRFINEENLFLPVSEDGETVNQIMVFSTTSPSGAA